MKRKRFATREEVVQSLAKGEIIFTRRGTDPYRPLRFYITQGRADSKRVHHNTLASLVEKGVIYGAENRLKKYELIKKEYVYT